MNGLEQTHKGTTDRGTPPGVGALVLLLCALALACGSGPVRPHVSLSAGAEPLRTQFNQDAGRVRILMIAAPT